MSSIPLKKLLLVTFLSTFFLGGTSAPTASPNQYVEHALRKRVHLDIVETTTTEHHTIDWIPIESQGKIASAPPLLKSNPNQNISAAISELQQPGAKLGPAGTVPIPRVSEAYLASAVKKQLPSKSSAKEKSKRQYAGDHWYVSADQAVSNLGGGAEISIWDPNVANPADFSLLQIAVTRETSLGIQTVEAGWINYPDQEFPPHLFTYYTTDSYKGNGNNIGGWNRDVIGWMQYSTTIFPLTTFSPTSTFGGTQEEISVEYYLYEGNWWLAVQGQWIGYYPGALFSNAAGSPSLATGSDAIYLYGEVYQSEESLTNTHMGSGQFAQGEYGYSAFLSNEYYIDTTGTGQQFAGSYWASDLNRYDYIYYPNSGTSRGTYVYLGGAGVNDGSV